MNLNDKQQEARNQVDGPLLIIAWAGSWKTATLTSRVEYMIKEKNIIPSNILMVTFTNKAAREMRERVGRNLWVSVDNNIYRSRNLPLIWTFHSIGIFLIKEVLNNFSADELNIWLKKDFVIYDESDKLSVLKSIIKENLSLEEKQFPARKIAFYISNAKNSLVMAKDYDVQVDSYIKEVVRDAYKIYEKKLKQNNAMDFDDILIKTLQILQVPRILDIYHERYKYLMVDEYQDTNLPQYEIVKLLASKYRNLAVVWDDSQSIYSWRGADMTNILNFKKDYREAKVVKLEQNYRSTKTIINAANNLIKNNQNAIKKDLWTDNDLWNKINIIEAPDDKVEAAVIVDIIKSKTSLQFSPSQEKEQEQEGGKYSDNLILYRTNGQSRQLEEALMMKGVPYRIIWGLKFYDRKEVKDILAYLKVIFNGDDVVSMKRIINTPSRKIWARTIEILDNYRENFGINYPGIIENIEELEEIKPMAKNSIWNFNDVYKSLVNASHKQNVFELIWTIIKSIWYEDYLKNDLSQEEFDAKMDNLKELKNVASEYNWMEPRESLANFLDEVALITDMDTKDTQEDYVTLMTIHTSKWLEEKRVFLAGLEDGIFPHIRSIESGADLEEERRLMYVAMTRAENELYISRAKERFFFWDYVRNPESRFLVEILPEYKEDFDLSSTSLGWGGLFSTSISSGMDFDLWNVWGSGQRITKPKVTNDVSSFAMWDRVSHHKFWNGIIVALNWEIAEIAFSWVGVKKMNIRIAPVKKV